MEKQSTRYTDKETALRRAEEINKGLRNNFSLQLAQAKIFAEAKSFWRDNYHKKYFLPK